MITSYIQVKLPIRNFGKISDIKYSLKILVKTAFWQNYCQKTPENYAKSFKIDGILEGSNLSHCGTKRAISKKLQKSQK